MNYGMIIYVLGWILNFEALFLLPSFVVALIYQEKDGMSILISAAVCLVLGLLAVARNRSGQRFMPEKVSLLWRSPGLC